MKNVLDIDYKECNIATERILPSKRIINVICVVIPLALFLCGVLSPIWTDNFFVYVFSLFPFYAYTYIIEDIFIDGTVLFRTERGLYASKKWTIGIITPAIMSIIGLFFTGNPDALYYGPCMILAFNIPVSIVYAVVCVFADSVRYSKPLRNFVA